MKNLYKKLGMLAMLFVMGVGGLQSAMAQGNSGNDGNGPGNSANAPGKNKNLGHGNASNGVKAIIQANRQIFYSGDLLEIGVRFPRGADLIQEGEADAYLMIFYPDTTLQAVSVSNEASAETSNLFRIDEVDVDFLPEGVYQLGVVLTVAGGDPLSMSDWYNGMLGLLTVRGLTVSAEPLDIDDDGDGFVDDDTTGDGFVDDDEDGIDEETDQPVEDESTDTGA